MEEEEHLHDECISQLSEDYPEMVVNPKKTENCTQPTPPSLGALQKLDCDLQDKFFVSQDKITPPVHGVPTPKQNNRLSRSKKNGGHDTDSSSATESAQPTPPCSVLLRRLEGHVQDSVFNSQKESDNLSGGLFITPRRISKLSRSKKRGIKNVQD